MNPKQKIAAFAGTPPAVHPGVIRPPYGRPTKTNRRIYVAGLGTTELLIVLAVVLLLFGGAKLPKLARSFGQARKEFDQGLSGREVDPPGGE